MGWPWDVRDEYSHQLDLLRESIVERVTELELRELNPPELTSSQQEYEAWRAAEEARYQLEAFDITYRLAERAEGDDPNDLGFLREVWPPPRHRL